MEKFVEVKPTFLNGKYDHISTIGRFNNGNLVLNGNTEVKVNDFYFYVENENGNYKSMYGKNLSKINNNSFIEKKNNKWKYNQNDVYEGNLDDTKRWLIDNVNVPMSKVSLNKMYFDIETDMSLDVENAPKPVTAICCFSNKIMKFIVFSWRYDFEDELKIINYDKNEFVINKETDEKSEYPVKVMIFNDERKMMIKFIEFCKDMKAHLYLGWNNDWYDNVYLYNRCLKHLNLGDEFKSHFGIFGCENNWNKKFNNYYFQMNGSFSLDMLQGYKKMSLGNLNSYSLKNCSKEILGDSKNEIELKNAWRKDFNSLIRYNVKDVKLLLDIDDKIGVTEFFDSKRRSIGCDWDNLFQNSKSIDVWFLRKAKQQNIVLPDPNYSFSYNNKDNKFSGAFVFNPIAGLYRWVVVLDLASLYPSIIQQFNLSPETIDPLGKIQTFNLEIPNYKRQDELLGFVPQTIGELQLIRKSIKKEMWKYDEESDEYKILNANQNVQKFLINSIYGVLGYNGCRIYNKEVAESVTTLGREIIGHTIKFIENKGHKVIYGDTDSTYVQINSTNLDDVIEIGNKLKDEINESYNDFVKQYGCVKNTNLEIEFEQVNRIMFIAGDGKGKGAKKRYVYAQEYKDGVKHKKVGFKGFEVVRSNASEVSKKVQIKLFEFLFDENNSKSQAKELFENWLRKFKQDLQDLKYPYSYIGIPQTLNKNTEDYKVTNPFVRATDYSNKYLDTSIGIDTKLKILYIKSIKGSPDTDSLIFQDEEDFIRTLNEKNIEFVIDWKLMFNKLIEDKIKNIYKELKWAKMGQETIDKWL